MRCPSSTLLPTRGTDCMTTSQVKTDGGWAITLALSDKLSLRAGRAEARIPSECCPCELALVPDWLLYLAV